MSETPRGGPSGGASCRLGGVGGVTRGRGGGVRAGGVSAAGVEEGGSLRGRTVVLGVTGSIAAYKTCEVASRLVQLGADVRVLMTAAATEFVSPLTFEALTHQPVGRSLFDGSEAGVGHVRLAREADALLIAPATANVLAKLANGFADDLLLTTALALPGRTPLLAAPAMEGRMWEHPATRQNVERLRERGVDVIPPASGRLASGAHGSGRMVEPGRLVQAVQQALGRNEGDLVGRRLVVTAGGTREPIDPVRHIANRSSGKMGFAVASAARDRGADVRLISGPTALAEPYGVACEQVTTAEEMANAVTRAVQDADALVMAAAPADYRPARPSAEKVKKADASRTLELVPTTDILQSLAGREGALLKVGFAAETSNVLRNAREKLERKGLHLLIANDVSDPSSGFEVNTNRVTIFHRGGESEALPILTKREVAEALLDRLAAIWKSNKGRR